MLKKWYKKKKKDMCNAKLFKQDLKMFKQLMKESSIDFPMGKLYPILHERFSESGTAQGHYFHQDLLVAQKIFLNQPKIHVDIGSSVDGFVAHVASFREIQVFDIRPNTNKIYNISFVKCDLMSGIDQSFINYCDSISSLHAIEHFGLGRYGDPIKYDGYLDGLNNIYDMLQKNGKFYFSVPMGWQRVEFNAHRVFSMEYLLDIFKEKYRIDSFNYVDDSGSLNRDVKLECSNDIKNNFGCEYGCAIFEMTKI